jgi:hypothetical protein
MQMNNFTTSKFKVPYLTSLLLVALLSFSGNTLFAQCNGTVSYGGTISANAYSGDAPLTVTIYNDVSPSGNAEWETKEYMFIVRENGFETTYMSTGPTFSFTFNTVGVMRYFVVLDM